MHFKNHFNVATSAIIRLWEPLLTKVIYLDFMGLFDITKLFSVYFTKVKGCKYHSRPRSLWAYETPLSFGYILVRMEILNYFFYYKSDHITSGSIFFAMIIFEVFHFVLRKDEKWEEFYSLFY